MNILFSRNHHRYQDRQWLVDIKLRDRSRSIISLSLAQSLTHHPNQTKPLPTTDLQMASTTTTTSSTTSSTTTTSEPVEYGPLPREQVVDQNYEPDHPLFLTSLPKDIETNPELLALQTTLYDATPAEVLQSARSLDSQLSCEIHTRYLNKRISHHVLGRHRLMHMTM